MALYSEEVSGDGELPANIMDSDLGDPSSQLIAEGDSAGGTVAGVDPVEQMLQAVVANQMHTEEVVASSTASPSATQQASVG